MYTGKNRIHNSAIQQLAMHWESHDALWMRLYRIDHQSICNELELALDSHM